MFTFVTLIVHKSRFDQQVKTLSCPPPLLAVSPLLLLRLSIPDEVDEDED